MDTDKKRWMDASKENWVTVKIWRKTAPVLAKIVKKVAGGKLTRGEVIDEALREYADRRNIKVPGGRHEMD